MPVAETWTGIDNAMKKIDISDMVPGTIAEGNYYTESGELLISKGVTILQNHIDVMTRRNIFEIFIKNFEEEEELHAILSREFGAMEEVALDKNAPSAAAPKDAGQRAAMQLPQLKAIKPGEEGALQLVKTKKVIELDSKLSTGLAPDRPIGPPLKDKARQIPVSQRTEDYKKEITLSHEQSLTHVKKLLNDLADNQRIDVADVRNIVELFMKTYLTDRSILLNIANIKASEGDYLFHHTLNVCLLAINIAAAAKYSERQILEIGTGALLHDAGMLLVPDEVRFKKGRLSKDEWFEVQKHAILGLHLIEKIVHVPDSVLFIAYQTHERENGKGYPKQRSGRFIHSFAKVVQIADVYESLCSQRDYRPPFIPYRAMELLIKMSSRNLLAIEYVKAFLAYASLFPIGSIVELNSHHVARVVQSNELHQAKPVVSVIMDSDGSLLAPEKIYQVDLSKETGVQIIRALEPGKLTPFDIMYGF
jgi:HD-GYP domain-containing protein (c-di-GMP phosphodiesterase class II)